MNKIELLNISRKVFHKYDLIWVIADDGPEDEYQMEESKISQFIYNNPHVIEKEIYNELVNIIEDWFWISPLDEVTTNTLNLMAKEMYNYINSTNLFDLN